MTVLTHKGQPQIGVRLPVSTALVEDDVLLEGIVAHEFLHCFHTLQEVIAGIKLGLRKINDQFDRSSREEDDARLAPLTDWFDQEISIPHHNEEACLRELKRHFVTLREELPIKTPTDEFVTHSLAIPDDVVEPIELLLRH